MEQIQNGGRVQRHNLDGLTVYLQPCQSFILTQPMASTGVRLQARKKGWLKFTRSLAEKSCAL